MEILNIKKFDIYNTKDQMVDYKKMTCITSMALMFKLKFQLSRNV